jgi:uncharacterized repeat protein (TIGR03806 family)
MGRGPRTTSLAIAALLAACANGGTLPGPDLQASRDVPVVDGTDASGDPGTDGHPADADAGDDASPTADPAPEAATDTPPDAPRDASDAPDTRPDAADASDAPDAPRDAADDAPDAADDGPRYSDACHPTGEPVPPPALALQRVLPGATLRKPVDLVVPPDGSGRAFLVEQPGVIRLVADMDQDQDPPPWLDLEARVDDTPNEGGLLGLAFAPDFAASGRFFVDYTRTQDGRFQTVVSRFTVPDPPLGAPDPLSERVILVVDQPYANHNGGQLAFGPDGLLYVGLGDGGSGGDPQGNGQRLDTLLGKILRLDADPPSGGYGIPADNPFAGRPDARGEIFAYGLRNPWRFSFDPVDGSLWAGDVGQNAWEEVDVVRKGGNYGWNVLEGTHCYSPSAGCDASGKEPPVAEYPHSEGLAVTGGHVYRGDAMPALKGTYLFADYAMGTVWGLSPDEGGAWTRTVLAETDLLVSALPRGPDGEAYVLDWGAGRAWRLVPADPSAQPTPGWPPTLGDTGCFADLPGLAPAAGVLPYEVNMPLWSDGAAKQRALSLPPGGRAGVTADGPWDLPVGSVLIKSFAMDLPSGPRRLETRFLVRDASGWRGATYRWRPDGSDADLLSGAATEDLGAGRRWYYPSRADCTACHTPASGQVLGVSTRQWNREGDVLRDGTPGNQVDDLAAAGYLDPPPAGPASTLPAFPAPGDETASVESRARAYLDSNCAHCHRPGGVASATLDLRHDRTLAQVNACGLPPTQGDLGLPGSLLVAPGDHAKSLLWLRMATTDPAVRMPPLASAVPDPVGLEVAGAWIDGLSSCGP